MSHRHTYPSPSSSASIGRSLGSPFHRSSCASSTSSTDSPAFKGEASTSTTGAKTVDDMFDLLKLPGIESNAADAVIKRHRCYDDYKKFSINPVSEVLSAFSVTMKTQTMQYLKYSASSGQAPGCQA
jgi:hypothetical protein